MRSQDWERRQEEQAAELLKQRLEILQHLESARLARVGETWALQPEQRIRIGELEYALRAVLGQQLLDRERGKAWRS